MNYGPGERPKDSDRKRGVNVKDARRDTRDGNRQELLFLAWPVFHGVSMDSLKYCWVLQYPIGPYKALPGYHSMP
jgi:hypothetical protein